MSFKRGTAWPDDESEGGNGVEVWCVPSDFMDCAQF